MNDTPIRLTSLSGSSAELGAGHGRTYAEEIRAYAEGRIALAGSGTDWDRSQLVALADEMLDAHRSYDGDLFEEMIAMAQSAGLTPAEAVIVGGYTDFIDVVASRAGVNAYEDDCTAVITPDAISEGAGFLAQTWDMNASATPHVIMLDLRPDHGPSALVFTTVGTLGQIGMNDAGIAVGINNLTAADGRMGVTWPFVVRKALAQSTFEDAVAAVADAHLAGGHNFLVFDSHGNGVSIEAMPTRTHIERLGGEALVHTNHCLHTSTRAVEGRRPPDLSHSSQLRISHASELLSGGVVDVGSLMRLTRDERSICRHPEPPYDYESCGAAIMRPATGDFWACWGVPSENEFEHFNVWASLGA